MLRDKLFIGIIMLLLLVTGASALTGNFTVDLLAAWSFDSNLNDDYGSFDLTNYGLSINGTTYNIGNGSLYLSNSGNYAYGAGPDYDFPFITLFTGLLGATIFYGKNSGSTTSNPDDFQGGDSL